MARACPPRAGAAAARAVPGVRVRRVQRVLDGDRVSSWSPGTASRRARSDCSRWSARRAPRPPRSAAGWPITVTAGAGAAAALTSGRGVHGAGRVRCRPASSVLAVAAVLLDFAVQCHQVMASRSCTSCSQPHAPARTPSTCRRSSPSARSARRLPARCMTRRLDRRDDLAAALPLVGLLIWATGPQGPGRRRQNRDNVAAMNAGAGLTDLPGPHVLAVVRHVLLPEHDSRLARATLPAHDAPGTPSRSMVNTASPTNWASSSGVAPLTSSTG